MMTIEETENFITSHFQALSTSKQCLHKSNCALRFNNFSYQIRPDDAFYYSDQILLFEYENTQRPVESISKYFWLFEKTDWLEQDVKIKLLFTINRQNVNTIRTQSIEILGRLLNEKYPNKFDFYFLQYRELNKESLLAELEKMTVL